MSYKEKYLDALKTINFYKIMSISLLVICVIHILLNMSLFFGYYFTIFLFSWAIIDFVKNFLRNKKEIKSLERTFL